MGVVPSFIYFRGVSFWLEGGIPFLESAWDDAGTSHDGRS